ncbi:hypothetical protein GGTG_13132 [Gaeumannomyces tritici R3-111a-1]|uniref:Uncharacterized protein n=1 Tax=Gaeumannomyces tritici (strain R3-111a-1) TaxID=644352 RepID=J3PI01_GAET3|nr:hypothetical protein GGTG_13132 [Gaeumannomyces tritici R3-111a-1]EJT69513.1 hypothetical protein GGTG_13132 [Gaeumannomyces tritici R3-111a-1]
MAKQLVRSTSPKGLVRCHDAWTSTPGPNAPPTYTPRMVDNSQTLHASSVDAKTTGMEHKDKDASPRR